MKAKELRNPLIQSAVVLVVIVFFISMIGGSESTSFFGMIGSIITGILKLVLFAIGLGIALIFSIACLIGVFFGAVALYSMDDCKRIFSQFLDNVARVKANYTGCEYTPTVVETPQVEIQTEEKVEEQEEIASADSAPAPMVEQPKAIAPEELEELKNQFNSSLSAINQSLSEIQAKETAIEETVASLTQQLQNTDSNDLTEQVNALATTQDTITTTAADQSKRLEAIETSVSNQSTAAAELNAQIASLNKGLGTVKKELDQLEELFTSPATDDEKGEADASALTEHRIFTYL
ncbi:MAG: hypothetical protein GY707_17225, partial [Desulfobacteraceae bacterium]|nr:hypothetical protein [Desulfobacteraceae bacterium]